MLTHDPQVDVIRAELYETGIKQGYHVTTVTEALSGAIPSRGPDGDTVRSCQITMAYCGIVAYGYPIKDVAAALRRPYRTVYDWARNEADDMGGWWPCAA